MCKKLEDPHEEHGSNSIGCVIWATGSSQRRAKNIETCHRRFTASLPNLLPRFSHIMNSGLHAAEFEQPDPYSSDRTKTYAKPNPIDLRCVLPASFSSAIMEKEMTDPPKSIASPSVN